MSRFNSYNFLYHIYFMYILLFTIFLFFKNIHKEKYYFLNIEMCHIFGILDGRGTLDRQWRTELTIFMLVSFYLY